jgi:hypothetical protein
MRVLRVNHAEAFPRGLPLAGLGLSKNPVAGGLHDVAVVPMDRIDHQLQRRIDDRARLLELIERRV